jgi:hypothetical protein
MTAPVDHVHYELNREITAIGGYYAFMKECTLPYAGRTILYYVGCAVMDSTCCGAGGIAFARVPGYIHDFRYKTDTTGAPISSIEPILDTDSRTYISKVLREAESVTQVDF